jgi:hypothetical protein
VKDAHGAPAPGDEAMVVESTQAALAHNDTQILARSKFNLVFLDTELKNITYCAITYVVHILYFVLQQPLEFQAYGETAEGREAIQGT